MTLPAINPLGFAAPTKPGELLNGARGHLRDQSVELDMGVVHLWVSPEDGPERYLRQLRTPALPGSGVCYQSGYNDPLKGRVWLWQTPDGRKTINPAEAAKWLGKPCGVSRIGADGNHTTPLSLGTGDPMPWCYGPGYHMVGGIDGNFHVAANPKLIAVNHAPPFNERAVAFVLPGTYNTDAGWRDATSTAELDALAKAMVSCNEWFGIPIAYVNAKRMHAGKKGWTGHVDVNDFARTPGHGDPGRNMPWGYTVLRAWHLRVGYWTEAELAGHVTFWGWADLKAGQKILNVPQTGEWDFITRVTYANVLAWLASL